MSDAVSYNDVSFMADHAVEALHSGVVSALKIDRLIYDSNTGQQRILIFENALFGRVMTLDGIVQVTLGDEFVYHEMMTHVPIIAHGAVKRVLVIGGGDGGIVREVLRHKAVQAVTLCDIDRSVIELTQTHMPALWGKAAQDPRLSIVVADGAEYVARPEIGKFDLIIVDSTDPIGPAKVLFSDTFYARVKQRLVPDGIVVTQNGVAFLQSSELVGTMRAFGSLFRDVGCYLATIPSYTGGGMAFGWGSDGQARHTTQAEIESRFLALGLATRYYSPAVHVSAFALPPYVAAYLTSEVQH